MASCLFLQSWLVICVYSSYPSQLYKSIPPIPNSCIYSSNYYFTNNPSFNYYIIYSTILLKEKFTIHIIYRYFFITFAILYNYVHVYCSVLISSKVFILLQRIIRSIAHWRRWVNFVLLSHAQMNNVDCVYSIQLNITQLLDNSVQEIGVDQVRELNITEPALFRLMHVSNILDDFVKISPDGFRQESCVHITNYRYILYGKFFIFYTGNYSNHLFVDLFPLLWCMELGSPQCPPENVSAKL